MRTFHWVSGELTEVQRFINVPMRWCEQYPARERRELWIRSACGMEVKLVVHARVMPARRGHHVLAVVHRKQLVGLRNLSTGAQVNFVRSDPPLLWRRCDGVALAAVVAVATGLALADLLAAAVAGLAAAALCTPLWVSARLVFRGRLARQIEDALDTASQQAAGRPAIRRVK